MGKKVLVIGPSIKKSHGGMASVIQNIYNDKNLNKEFDIKIFSSYVDGNIIKRGIYSLIKILYFIFIFYRYDIFHIHVASYGSFFRKRIYVNLLHRFSKKIILHLHGAAFLEFYDGSKEKDKIKRTFKRCDKIIVLSESWKKEIKKRMNLENIIVINNGVIFHKNHIGLVNDNSFIFLGKLGKRKGTYDLLKAIKKVKIDYPKIKFYLCGDGETEKVERIVQQEKLQDVVSVEGWCSKNKIDDIFKKVSTMILPSYNEGLPMSILEAMEQGKIIISSPVGGIPEVVKDSENGYIVDAGDIEQIKNAIVKVITNHDKNIIISNNNIKKVEKSYNLSNINNSIGEVYRSLMN